MTKKLLITGGSRGIGRATALLAGARGWSVAINYVSDAAAAEATAEDARAAGGAAMIVKGDVGVEADVIRMFDEAEAAFGGLDCVVANAGIVGPTAAIADMTLERMQRVVHTNVVGAL
ncbi:MAG: SDR family NAD(P)-dependent oxidoreductase, partial [Pseudomonadota bacterium]